MAERARRWIGICVLVLAAATATRARADDDAHWEVGGAIGFADLLYTSPASLQRPPRTSFLIPSGRCPRCIDSAGEVADLSLSWLFARAALARVRVIAALDVSRHPSFDLALASGAIGIGVGSYEGAAPLEGHVAVLGGAARIDGPTHAIAPEVQIRIELGYQVGRQTSIGYLGALSLLIGSEPATDGRVFVGALYVARRW